MEYPPARSQKRFPWYDSYWMNAYLLAREFIRQYYPQKRSDFVGALEVLRTDLDFQVKSLPSLFDARQQAEMCELIHGLQKTELETHETFRFGRDVVHNHPYFSNLQQAITDVVSDAVNERVEPSYNFLSLYHNFGVCGVHLDAPSAKWTVDYCIEQSAPWPIYLSRVRPWPEDWSCDESDWEDAVKNDPLNQFAPFELREGEAIVFGGSSQWHYRDRIEQRIRKNYCHLVFFHYIPYGASDLAKPESWAQLFGVPELAGMLAPLLKPATTPDGS